MQDGSTRSLHTSSDMFPDEKRLAMWRGAEWRGITPGGVGAAADTPLHADVTFNIRPNVAIASGSRSPAHYHVTREMLKDARDTISFSILRSGEASATQVGQGSVSGIGSASVLSAVDPSISTL